MNAIVTFFLGSFFATDRTNAAVYMYELAILMAIFTDALKKFPYHASSFFQKVFTAYLRYPFNKGLTMIILTVDDDIEDHEFFLKSLASLIRWLYA